MEWHNFGGWHKTSETKHRTVPVESFLGPLNIDQFTAVKFFNERPRCLGHVNQVPVPLIRSFMGEEIGGERMPVNISGMHSQ